jgi:hypothetical protein
MSATNAGPGSRMVSSTRGRGGGRAGCRATI